MPYSVINMQFESLRDKFESAIRNFDSSGELIYRKRNQVRIIEINSQKFVFKKFGKNFYHSLISRMGAKSKARKAYEIGERLLSLGVVTPYPIAYFNAESGYFISEYCESSSLADILRRRDFDREIAARFAKFIAHLHDLGIEHRDLNLSNILYMKDREGERFILIDTNRTRFHFLSYNSVIKNLKRITHRRDLIRAILCVYARERRYDELKLIKDTYRELLKFEKSKTIRHRIARFLHLRK